MDAKIQERDRRLALFNNLMEAENLDGLIFTSTAQQTCQIAVKYATNYPLTTRRGFACMARGRMPRLFLPTVGQQFQGTELAAFGGYRQRRSDDWGAGVHPVPSGGPPEDRPV